MSLQRSIHALLSGILALCVASLAARSATAQARARSAELERLLAGATLAGTNVPASDPAQHALTQDGALRYLGAPMGAHFRLARVPRSPERAALAFLNTYRGLFGITSDAVDFEVARVVEHGAATAVRLRQTYAGIPILAGEVSVQVDSELAVICVLCDILRDTSSLDTGLTALEPLVTEEAALGAVGGLLAAEVPGAAFTLASPALELFAPTVVDLPGEARLVWIVRVASDQAPTLGADILLDARTAGILQRFPRVCTALDREIYDANNMNATGTLERDEGDPPSGIGEVDDVYDFFGDTYDFYQNEHGRDGINGSGMTMSATVRYCTSNPADTCPYGNAYWDGSRMYFGDGYGDDDVTAHELTHGVTQFESNLAYANTSGALNESFSDVWGESVDLGNGRGNDAAAVRWDLGEDLPGGRIRDMANPPALFNPDRVGSPLYTPPAATPSQANDYGGVHNNSGVNNKLCFLLTDGDTFRGHSIAGLGIPRVADLYYEAQTSLLTSGADWTDLFNALTQAAVNQGWSQVERDNLFCACVSVEITTDTVNPTIACPSSVTTECASPSGNSALTDPIIAGFLAGASADDTCTVQITTDAPLLFPHGTTQVTFTARDPSGNSASCSANVEVVDTTAPVIDCPPDITVGTDPGQCSAVVTFETTATDNCSFPSISDFPTSGSVFPKGTTIVSSTATDDVGLTSDCTFTITVVDDEPPQVTSAVSVPLLWPPNHDLVSVGLDVVATDNCPGVTTVVRVFSDEDDEEQTGDGSASPDAKDLAPATLRLRKERRGDSNGRVYLIVVTATDEAGNTNFACSTVVTPRSLNLAHLMSVHAQAAAARAYCDSNAGAIPPGFAVVGDGPVIGPQQ